MRKGKNSHLGPHSTLLDQAHPLVGKHIWVWGPPQMPLANCSWQAHSGGVDHQSSAGTEAKIRNERQRERKITHLPPNDRTPPQRPNSSPAHTPPPPTRRKVPPPPATAASQPAARLCPGSKVVVGRGELARGKNASAHFVTGAPSVFLCGLTAGPRL